MRHLVFDILLIFCFSISIGFNIVQFYTFNYLEKMYFKQCGSSIIAIRESELNKMFDQLEEGSEK
jgi:hypothetical protein